MKISAIVIVYNLEKYIDDALQSVFTQTRKADEVIVVDDCSTDNSFNIINKYSEKIKYIRQNENVGALKNALSGVKQATGDIVAFLDGDDVWMPEKLEEVEKEFLKDEFISLVSHDFIRVDENLKNLNIEDETNLNTKKIVTQFKAEEWSDQYKRSILLRKGFWLGSAYAIKKNNIQLQEFENIIENFAESRFSYLDMTIGPFIVASDPDCKVGFVNKILFKYRVHTNNSWTYENTEKALASIKRLQAINTTTYHIISQYLPDKKIQKRYQDNYNVLELMKLEYSNAKVKAIFKFISVIPFLYNEKKLFHEFKRLITTTFLGASAFIKLRAIKNKSEI